MKMAKIKRILKLAEINPNFSSRTIRKIVNCSEDTVGFILSAAASLPIKYDSIKDLDEKEIHELFYPNNNSYHGVPEPDVNCCIKELKKKHVLVKLFHEEYLEKYPNGLK